MRSIVLSTAALYAFDLVTCSWIYRSQADLDGSYHSGMIENYDGGGFAQVLGANRSASLSIIRQLRADRWIDRRTRAVFVDFTLYNAELNVFAAIRFSPHSSIQCCK